MWFTMVVVDAKILLNIIIGPQVFGILKGTGLYL